MNRSTRRLGATQWVPKLQRILQNKGINGLSDPCLSYFQRNKRHLLGGILVVCFFAFLTPFTIISTHRKVQRLLPNGDLPEYQQWENTLTQIATDNGDIVKQKNMKDNIQNQNQNDSGPYGNCIINQPENTDRAIQPVLVPTFPGGSADLMKFLIEATTGIWTGNKPDMHDVVAIKTHYPYYNKHVSVKALNKSENPSAVIILRDPLNTMEIWHTYIENSLNQREQRNEQQSVKKWMEWRDHHFVEEIEKWSEFLKYWLDRDTVPLDRRHVVVYEDLVDLNAGSDIATGMVEFILQMTDIPRFVPRNKLPCIWHQVLQLKADPYQMQQQPIQQQPNQQQPNQHHRILRNTKKEVASNENNVNNNINHQRPYSYLQLDKVASTLTDMIEDYSYDQKVVATLMKYRASIMDRMAILKGNDNDPILVQNAHGNCIVTSPKYEPGIVPIFQASYPGSGSEMMRDLLEAITGYKTNESHRRNDVVAVKTMYPYRKLDLAPGFLNRDMKRLILVVRYPLHAIVSNFEHLYWTSNNIAPHSMQPPTEAWEKWRDQNLMNEIDAWIEHFMFWTNAFKEANRIVVPYESMYHSEKGPKQATRLGYFIKGSGGSGTYIDTAPAFTIPCLWFRAVRINDQADTDVYIANRYHKNSNFTKEQLEAVATKINVAFRKFNYDLQIGTLLKSYWEHTISLIQAEN